MDCIWIVSFNIWATWSEHRQEVGTKQILLDERAVVEDIRKAGQPIAPLPLMPIPCLMNVGDEYGQHFIAFHNMS